MGGEWKDASLSELIKLQRGHDLTDSERHPGEIPVMGSAGQNGYHNTSKAKGPGLVIGRSGASFGRVHFSETDYWPHNTALYVTDFLGNDELFTFHLLKTIDFSSYNSGSAQPSLNRNHIYLIPVKIPPLPEQKAIAHILGSLDDKIELNRRMNATLEGMVQALFKSWFVDFDPVIDNALAAGNLIPEELAERAEVRRQALADGTANREAAKQFPAAFQLSEEMGWIPEGWVVSTIGDEVTAVGGGTPSTANALFWNGTHPFCTPKDMSSLSSLVLSDTERHLTDVGANKISSGILPEGTLLMSSRAPIGYLAISEKPATVNQGIIALVKNDTYQPMFLLSWLRSNMEKIIERANGSTFLEISKKNFKPIPFLRPSEKVLTLFNIPANSIHRKIVNCVSNTNYLTNLRDTLLPKLISGELRIPAAEKLTEEALA